MFQGLLTLHILILPSWYPRHRDDPQGCFFREQALALYRKDLKVGVVALQTYGLTEIQSFFKERYRAGCENDQGVLTYREQVLYTYPRLPNLQFRQYVAAGIKAFLKYQKKHGQPDLIHVHSIFNAGFLAQAISQRFGIPFVITEHSTAYARNMISEVDLQRAAQCAAAAVSRIAVSSAFAQLLNQKLLGVNSSKSWSVVPNIVEHRFLQVPLSCPPRSPFVFCTVCFLTHKKRVDLLIRAFAQAFADQPYIRLHIGGSGEELTRLMNIREELSMEKQISFQGPLNRDEVLNTVQAAHVYVMSSDVETFGVTLIEAMALGKPLIATRCGGPEDILTEETGILIEPNHQDALAEALLQMYTHYGDYSPEYSRVHCQTHYSEEAVTQRLIAHYKDIFQQPS